MIPAADYNQALALLDRYRFWCLKVSNSGDRKGYECTIRDNGKLIRVCRRTPIEAVNAAMNQYEQRTSPKLRLAR